MRYGTSGLDKIFVWAGVRKSGKKCVDGVGVSVMRVIPFGEGMMRPAVKAAVHLGMYSAG